MSDSDSRENPETAGTLGSGDEAGDRLSTILSYLIRSGQVRILTNRGMNGEDDDLMDDDDSDDDWLGTTSRTSSPPSGDPNPDTSAMDMSELKQDILLQSGLCHYHKCKKPSMSQILQRREIGMLHGQQNFSQGHCCYINSNFLPNDMQAVARYRHKAFCGTYSADGNIFLTACQDQNIRIYDTSQGRFNQFKSIRARDVGWSVLDTAFSSDGNYLVYSSWSEAIHICNIHGDVDKHDALHLFPAGESSFCIFSLTFSTDNKEILGGANDGCLYLYDRERNQSTLRIDAHEDDVNAVAFADDSSNILFSGGDDGLVKVWDRRTLSEETPIPVGVLAGHMDGITYIDSKGDARYVLSNCKDQTIKLWDIRRFSSDDAQEATKREVAKQNWDYRWQSVPRKGKSTNKKFLPGDSSLMTYRGHRILHTLVRCHFSPAFTTGQRYIYSGCATGSVIIYDVLTGEIVSRLTGHRACVRDISWHPYERKILSTSWDGSIGEWTYKPDTDIYETSGEDTHSDSDSDVDRSNLRRSERIRKQRRQQGRPQRRFRFAMS